MGKTPDTESAADQAVDADAEAAASDVVATTTVEWDGKTWTVPADVDDWPFDASVAMESGKPMVFLTHLLGAQQMRQFRAGKRRTTRDGAHLVKQIMVDAYGGTEGE